MFGEEYTDEEIRYYERREGRREGREKGQKKLILEMLKNGMTVDQITKFCKLPKDTIQELAAELN